MNSLFIKAVSFIGLIFCLSVYSQDLSIADSNLRILYSSGELTEQNRKDIYYEIIRNHTHADTILKYSEKLVFAAQEKDPDKTKLFKGYYYNGIAYNVKGNYEKALRSFFKSAEIGKSINCLSCLSAAYVAIGDVYSVSMNNKNAIFYYNKAIQLSTELNDSVFLASSLLNAGGVYLDINELDSAMIYFRRSNKLFKSLQNDIGIAYSMGNIGKVYSEKQMYNLAEEYISSAVSMLEEYQDYYALSIYYFYLSEIYKQRNEINAALEYASISLETAKHANLLPQVRDAYELLTELFALHGDLDKAFECQSNYIATRDSINNEETIRKMADLRTEYEVAQKQAEVDLLNKKRQNQRIIVISLFVVLVLTAGLFLVLYTNSRKRKQLNKKLVQRQKELQQQHDQLEKLNKTKDRFFSIISHDLRGPINVLNGTTLLIRDFLDSKNYDELDELTVNMEYSVKKVQNLLDNLLEWAVSQQGEFPYRPERLDMDEICDNVLNIFIAMAATKSIILTYEVKSNARFITADKNSLMTIIRNLVSNALKFTRQDGAVNILAEQKNGNYCISVSDTGIGIPEEKQKDLFKLIDNKSTWGTAKEKGLGIGLSLVHEFVKMNKGSIMVDSTIDVGTTFTVCLPLESKTTDTKNTQKKKPKNVSSKYGN
jgi:two-component system NtrC family sensor kinase